MFSSHNIAKLTELQYIVMLAVILQYLQLCYKP